MEPILIISTILLWVIVLFNLLLTFGLIRRMNARSGMPAIETLEIGQPAPDFTAQTLDDDLVTLAQYTGQQLALIFISPTCKPCVEKLPDLEALAPKAKQHGVTLLLVYKANAKETRASVTEHGITLPILISSKSEHSLWRNYKVGGTPFYCVLDASHKVVSTGLLGSEWDVLARDWLTN